MGWTKRHTLFAAAALMTGLGACGGFGAATANAAGTAGFPAPTGGDLCAGLAVTGKSRVAYTALAKPAKLHAVNDPDFGTRIVRITDARADWGANVAVPVYPTIQAWNADESLLFLYVTGGRKTGHALFDGRTYTLIKFIDINPADVEQVYWHPTNPDVLMYVDNRDSGGTYLRELVAYNVRTGHRSIVRSFTGDVQLSPIAGKIGGGGDPFAPSADGDLFGLGVYQQKNGPGGAALHLQFSYRISSNRVRVLGLHEGNVAQALPSGRGLMLGEEKTVRVLSEAGSVQRTIAFGGTEHGDMMRNAAGDDLFAAVQFDGPSGSGVLMFANLTKGTVETVVGEATGDGYPTSGVLISGRATHAPGWVALAATGCPTGTNGNCNGFVPKVTSNPRTFVDQEIILANVDTGRICRVAHHRTTGSYNNARQSNYWAQPNLVISPSGTRILFASDWGAANPLHPVVNPDAAIDTYVVELPGYRH